MKVLFNTSKSAFRSPGGGEMQMLKTAEHLRRKGIEVDIAGSEIEWGNYDLLHNFNIHSDNAALVCEAKGNGLGVAVSTIYWPSLKFALLGSMGLKGKAMAAASRLNNRLNPFSSPGKIVKAADVLLPNSFAEKKILEREFHVTGSSIDVVWNAVDRDYTGKAELFEKEFGLQGFVLYVGRIEPRKNVLALVKAVNGTGLELVVIGEATHFSKAYAGKCRQAAGKRVHFLGAMEHESELLKSAYAAAKVFALPSWYETPGLAALEAGLNECNIVITSEGSAREYFGELASYVNPRNAEEIRQGIEKEFAKEPNKKLASRIANNFVWEKTAEKTLQAYKKIA